MSFARLSRVLMLPAVAAPLAIGLLLFAAAAEQDASPISLRLIVVSSAAEADRVLERLKSGADFAVLAREGSVDATSVDGGLLGKVDPATLRAELRDAIQGVEPGQVSRVFKLPSGFAILKVLRPGEIEDLENTERARQFAVSAEGSVRFDFDISGINEAESALANFPKPADWYMDLRGACEYRRQSLAAVQERADQLLDPAQLRDRSPADVMSMRVAQGQLHAYKGEMDQAVAPWEMAYHMAQTDLPRALPYLEELLGIGYLHKSEIANDVYRNPGERCLFPLRPGVRYGKTADSEKAIQYFLKFLK